MNLEYPERPIITEGNNINGFIILNFTVAIHSFQFFDYMCGGSLCDQKSLMNIYVVLNCCPCIQMVNRVEIYSIHWDEKLTLEYGTNITTQMSKKWFMQQYILTGELNSGTQAVQFEDY